MLITEFLDIEEKIIPRKFWDEISIFSDIIIPVSGGIDSTVIVNEFEKKGIEYRLIWGNTLRSLKTARKTLCEIFVKSKKMFDFTIPYDNQKMITDKSRDMMKKIVSGKRKYVRHDFSCCYYLKTKPFYKWLKINSGNDSVIISGIAGYEGIQRQTHLGVLRKRNTFLRYRKTNGRWFAYPLRDFTSRLKSKRLKGSLYGTVYSDTVRSGCHTCPVVALFEEAIEDDLKRIKASKKVYGGRKT